MEIEPFPAGETILSAAINKYALQAYPLEIGLIYFPTL
jgi:hypothetical protein